MFPAFIYGLMNNMSIEEAMRFGSASASIVISKHSSSDAMPTVKEIKDFMNETKVIEQTQPI